MGNCHICGEELETMVDFGTLPLANNYVKRNMDGTFPKEYVYNGEWAWCNSCELLQLVNPPDDKLMFTDAYPYRTSTSQSMLNHFRDAADFIWDTFKPDHVAEIGASDGGMIQFLTGRCHRVGFEPSDECRVDLARKYGIASYDRFDENSAMHAVDYQGAGFDIIYSANTLRSIVNLGEILEVARGSLAPAGVLIIEEPYLPSIIESKGYDQFYDENVHCFTLASMAKIVERYGMSLGGAMKIDTHGGSMRYFIHKGESLYATLPEEIKALKAEVKKFFGDALLSTEAFSKELIKLSKSNAIIVGLGATAKSSTTLVTMGETRHLIERIYDNTPSKIGLYTPLAHIPIDSEVFFRDDDFDVCVLFAWNHAEEVKRKHPATRFLVYAPELRYL